MAEQFSGGFGPRLFMTLEQLHEASRKLAARRIDAGRASVKLLSAMTGLSPAHVSMFVHGRKRLSIRSLSRMLIALDFGVEPMPLGNREPAKHPPTPTKRERTIIVKRKEVYQGTNIAEASKIGANVRFAVLGRALADAAIAGAIDDALLGELAMLREREHQNSGWVVRFAALARQIGDAVSGGRDASELVEELKLLRSRELGSDAAREGRRLRRSL